MNITELTDKIIQKIVGIYPDIDISELRRKVSEMQIVETEIGEKSPFIFEQGNNILKLNPEVIATGNYDLEYYMTVTLLLMTKPYVPSLQGLRTGYFAGIASNLVGNFTNETATTVEPGIDIYESLRAGIADLNSRLGAVKASDLCEVNRFEDFISMAIDLGLENPEQFLEPYNYLAINSANLSETQISSLVTDLEKSNQTLTPQLSDIKTI